VPLLIDPDILRDGAGGVVRLRREKGQRDGPLTAVGLAALAEWLCRMTVDVFTIAESPT
jgi:N-acyl-D-aspartate/D-glutamate deacylase